MTHAHPLHYCLDPYDLSGHRCRVTLRIPSPQPSGQKISMPAWIPGSYLMREFGRQIETLEVLDAQHRPLAHTKLDRNTWQIAPSTGPITIKIVVYCFDLSVRGAHLDDTHGFFNGTSVFLLAHGQENQPCLLELLPPNPAATHTAQPWQVYTSLPEAKHHPGAASRHGFGYYLAPNYDALIDHPIEMGTPRVVSFEAHGSLHEMVFTGQVTHLDIERLAQDTRRICEAQIAFFEPDTRRAPFLDSSDRYVFITLVTADGYGGLEHRASTALMANRNDLPVLGQATQSDGYRTFLGLVSHEYFHTWNVKRIKPAAFTPYNLSRESHTRLLWVFEGFTSYYDDLLLLRAGVIDLPAYLQRLSQVITQVHRHGGRHKQTVAESSFDAWTRYYRQDENSPNALVSYYTKGALVALGLDLHIRITTQDTRSLDDVMRLMWQRHGRDFYTGAPTGVGENEMGELITAATGVDATAYLQQYVDGVADVPLQHLLPHAGFQLQWQTPDELPVSIDWRTRSQGHDLAVATVYEHGNAHQAGISAGDLLVALDEVRITTANVNALLRRYRPGDQATLHVFRGDVLRTLNLTFVAPNATEARIERFQGSASD